MRAIKRWKVDNRDYYITVTPRANDGVPSTGFVLAYGNDKEVIYENTHWSLERIKEVCKEKYEESFMRNPALPKEFRDEGFVVYNEPSYIPKPKKEEEESVEPSVLDDIIWAENLLDNNVSLIKDFCKEERSDLEIGFFLGGLAVRLENLESLMIETKDNIRNQTKPIK